jgi:hypothetical protein
MIGLKLAAVAALAAIGLFDGTLLKRDLKTGETTAYEVKCTRTSGTEDGSRDPHSMTATWNAVYTLGTVDADKGAELTVNISDFKMQTDMEMPGGGPPATRTAHATVSPKGGITQKEPNSPNMTGAGWLGMDSIELPNTDVKIGDTWDITLPQTLGMGEKVPAKAKLEGEQDFAGHAAWKVTVEAMKLKFANKAKVRFGGPDAEEKEATVEGTGNVHVEALIEKATGRVLSLTQKTHRVQTLSVVDGMDQAPMVIDDVATMKMKG